MNPDDAGFFIPVNVGQLNSQNPSIQYNAGTCFKNIKFTYSQSNNENGDIGDIVLNIDTE